MFCKYCGTKLDDDAKFCPRCGANLLNNATPHTSPAATEVGSDVPPHVSPVATEVAYGVVEDKPPKVWSVFALISKIVGIVCLVGAFIPFLNYIVFSFGIAGIVFGCLGRKARNPAADNNCKIGFGLSVAAVAVSLVMIVVYSIVLFSGIKDLIML